MYLVTEAHSVCIFFLLYLFYSLWITLKMLSVFCMDVWHAMYRVIYICTRGNVFLDMCLSYLYFLFDWVWQYLEIYQNNVTHISVRQRVLRIWKGKHFHHVTLWWCVLYITTMRSYTLLISLKNTTFCFTRTSVFARCDFFQYFFHITVTPC